MQVNQAVAGQLLQASLDLWQLAFKLRSRERQPEEALFRQNAGQGGQRGLRC